MKSTFWEGLEDVTPLKDVMYWVGLYVSRKYITDSCHSYMQSRGYYTNKSQGTIEQVNPAVRVQIYTEGKEANGLVAYVPSALALVPYFRHSLVCRGLRCPFTMTLI